VGKSNGQLRQDIQIGVAQKKESGLALNKIINKKPIIKNKTRLITKSQIKSLKITKIM
jgi:hypothetical protein